MVVKPKDSTNGLIDKSSAALFASHDMEPSPLINNNTNNNSSKRPSLSTANSESKRLKPTTTTTMTTTNTTTTTQFPPPKVLTYPSSTPPILITQGAEGRLYKTTYLSPSIPCALKYRPPKPYRHPILDARLTKARLSAEAKVLERCWREGIPVPAVYAVDTSAGWMAIEWIDGPPVRAGINEWLGDPPEVEQDGGHQQDKKKENADEDEGEAPMVDLMRRIGLAVGRLHNLAGVVHGDLTTSNMMLRPPLDGGDAAQGKAGKALEGEVVLIDFGLATQSQSDEDRAVDLYVLERAFLSTHPRAERLFGEVLEAYRGSFKKAASVLVKLEDVRMRGRKKSMIG